MKSPEQKKLPFLVLKKRPTEALFKAIEMELFCEDLECMAGLASEKFNHIRIVRKYKKLK